jgi:transcriptional antiterminator RfaH
MKSWYVVHTKPRNESVAEAHLRRQAFETYLPRIKLERRRGGKWVEVIEPLFPRYLFVQLDAVRQNIAPIRSTHGVSCLVMFGGRLRPVPNEIVEGLQRAASPETGLHAIPRRRLQEGDAVTVASGPFEGLRGIFKASSGQERVAVLLELLGRTATVVLNGSSVVPASAGLAGMRT